MASPWYHTTPRSDAGASGLTIAFHRADDLMPNIDADTWSLASDADASAAGGVQPSADVPPKLLSINPIGTPCIAGSSISATAKKKPTALKSRATFGSLGFHFASRCVAGVSEPHLGTLRNRRVG